MAAPPPGQQGVAPGTGPWGQVPQGPQFAPPMAAPPPGQQGPVAAPGTGPWGQVPPVPQPFAPPSAGQPPGTPAAGPWGHPPGPQPGVVGHGRPAPQRSRSIVADLDVPERDLNERPRRLMPGSMALVVVSLLVLGIAGGGGYLAWQRSQAPANIEPTLEPETPPEAVIPPPAEVPETVPSPVGPDSTGTTPGPTTPGPTTPGPTTPGPTPTTPGPKTPTPTTPKSDKTGKSGTTSTPKKPPAEKADSSTKSGSGGTKKVEKVEKVDDPLSKRKEQADAADPGRVLVELEYLSAIDKALKAGNWAQALAYVEQHDKELPGGQLVDKFDERRIRALCGMGRTSEAQAKVTQILAKRPSSKVKTALAESCK
ncbi:hypothetical protein OV090_28725 [Nannocystis sp. RBIL2]|uniref:hypothetical protein n=1 Tax=Nannocystis sp. RBIL2 TaxID=2996788 RepID=UPI0022711494|nr:hypothetical protein [Nannocystis sp. RBIL2]MCY1068757.1 hypothetical protein [Nannocystis sp. RBIL2]